MKRTPASASSSSREKKQTQEIVMDPVRSTLELIPTELYALRHYLSVFLTPPWARKLDIVKTANPHLRNREALLLFDCPEWTRMGSYTDSKCHSQEKL